jgi:hypothetical protein
MQNTLPSFSLAAQSLVPGNIYEHYSGKKYKFLSVARHSETLEELAIYQALYGKLDVWVRPLDMFLEHVTINGNEILRFSLQP